jgi:hypothetical protein
MVSVAMKPRTKWIIALAVVVVLMGAYVAPLLRNYPEQDSCSFGPVSNERYRELLSDAKRRQATTWPALVRDDYKASVLLNERFDDLGRDLTTVYEKIAAMHAILRALNADYRAAWSGQDPYQAAMRSGGIAGFTYHIDINHLGLFAPIWRRAQFNGVISAGGIQAGNRTDPVRYSRGVVSFGVLFPKLIETYQFEPRSPFGEVCPLVPTPEQAEHFTQGGK